MDSCSNMEGLRLALIGAVNSSGLTVGAALYIVKDIYNTLYISYLDEIQKEKNRQSAEVEEQIVPTMYEEEEVTENGNENND